MWFESCQKLLQGNTYYLSFAIGGILLIIDNLWFEEDTYEFSNFKIIYIDDPCVDVKLMVETIPSV